MKGVSQPEKFDFSYVTFFGSNFENDTVSIKNQWDTNRWQVYYHVIQDGE
jgi:hypothetical protein